MMLSKEDMALEALVKLVVNIKSQGAENHFDLHTLDYAEDALKANGWEIFKSGAFGRVTAKKISFKDQQSLTGANGPEAHQEAVRKHFPERLEDK